MLPIFRKYKLPTLLNVLGLAVALAAFYLFFTQVEYGYKFNTAIKDYDKVYRVEPLLENWFGGDKWLPGIPQPVAIAMNDIPQIDTMFLAHNYRGEANVIVDEKEFDISQHFVARNFVDFTGIKLLYGSVNDFIGNNYLISRSEALRLFGKENAVGLSFSNKYGRQGELLNIVGVIDDLPENFYLKDGLFRNTIDAGIDQMENWSYCTLVKINDKKDVPVVTESIISCFNKKFADYGYGKPPKDVRLTPVSKTYFSGVAESDIGKKTIIDILFAAGIFVLLVAFLNLSNYSLALAPMRIRGVNTRKVLGATDAGLRLSVIFENVLLAVIALIIAFVIVDIFSKSAWCSSLSICSLAIGSHVELAVSTAVIGLLIGIFSAVYPAFYATSFAPALVLKGSFALSIQGKKLRMAMLSVQFMVAFFFVAYIMLLKSQSYYIYNSDYGFDKDVVLMSSLSKEGVKKKEAVRDAFLKMPFVERVSYGQGVIGTDNVFGEGRGKGERYMEYHTVGVDSEYMRTYGIKILEGRDFNEQDAMIGTCIVNNAMKKRYPWLTIGQKLLAGVADGTDPDVTIVGVCDDIVATPMTEGDKQTSMVFILPKHDRPHFSGGMSDVFVRVKAGYDKVEARRKLAEAMKEIDGSQEYDFQFLDDKMEVTYQEEFRFISQVEVFALICILITLVGVFCLTMFESEYRRKEVALRKIMGSTTGEVIRLFTSKYILPLILSFIIVAPVAYVYGAKWLEGFANRTPIHWWLFPLALVLVSSIVLITVVVQCWKVARSNPIESIRTE